MDLIKRAAEWGSGYAAGGSGKNRAFLEEISQGKGKDFFEEVIKAYESGWEPEVRGGCGHVIGGNKYLSHMEGEVFLRELPADNSARWGGADYAGALKESIEGIARQMERDLERGERENSYITDETERALKLAAVELGRCGAGIGSLGGKIERLAWFVGGDPSKIRQLQSKLNQIGVGEHLTEDGVYGKKTLAIRSAFFENLIHGTVPSLTWIDPLQSSYTQIYSVPIQKNSISISSLRDFSSRSINLKGTTVFRADTPHSGFTYHINTVEGRSIKTGQYAASKLQLQNLNKLNHTEISYDAFQVLRNFDGVAKKIRIAGKVLLAAGVALDVLELSRTIEDDLQDADRKIGKETYSEIASIGGSWAIGALGAESGTLLGASVGTAIFPGVGTVIGGAIGGLVLGLAGSFAGDRLGSFVIDITMVE
ncbi:complement resistance protein TraT [Oscillibacter sp. MSJ-2]|uniref:Complement resistance protein TraT n=1 Tax=Dysosmobacter acutus TaxID=2841504 RepID=A0ABS6FC41_9FIRM|nr:complement resistance protein TraT [Dysosmobacter acutus]